MYEIITIENDETNVLRKDVVEIKDFEMHKEIFMNMKQMLDDNPAIAGIAAPQIGLSKAMFVVRFGKNNTKIIINPIILKEGKTKETKNEGCLSIPDQKFPVARSRKISVRYYNENGKPTIAKLLDMDARRFLHEYDHLKGVLISD